MLNKICNYISMILVDNKKIDLKDKDKFRFGLEVLISQGLVFSSIIILSFILSRFYEALLFIWVFGSLRQNSYGYHASTLCGCFFLTLLSFILCVAMHRINNFVLYLILMISMFLFIIILFRKKKSINKQFVILFFIHLLTFFALNQMGFTIAYIIPITISIVILSLLFD